MRNAMARQDYMYYAYRGLYQGQGNFVMHFDWWRRTQREVEED